MKLDPLRHQEWKLELRAKLKVLLDIRHMVEPEIRQIEETLKTVFGEGN